MKLFINEFIKDYRKISTYIYLFISLGIICLVNVMQKNSETSLVTSVSATTGVVMSVVSIFTLIMFANNLSQEYSKGTIKFLYSKPKSRSSILTSKICLAIFNFIFFSLLVFVFDIVIKKYLFYKNELNLHTIFTQKIEADAFGRLVWEQMLINSLTSLVVTLFYIALVLLICVVFKTQILSLIIVLFMVIGGSIISSLTTLIIGKFEYIKYIFTNVPQLTTYYSSETGKKIIEESLKLNATHLLLMALSYTVFFAIVAYIINARRDITID